MSIMEQKRKWDGGEGGTWNKVGSLENLTKIYSFDEQTTDRSPLPLNCEKTIALFCADKRWVRCGENVIGSFFRRKSLHESILI